MTDPNESPTIHQLIERIDALENSLRFNNEALEDLRGQLSAKDQDCERWIERFKKLERERDAMREILR